jgi:hypothetical protein
MRQMRLAGLTTIAVLVTLGLGRAADRYTGAKVDPTGVLQIRIADGRVIPIKKKPAQEAFDRIEVAADGSALGWTEEYPNCCTSYPIPLTLVIYFGGSTREFKGRELPIFNWHFTADSRQFAFEQETVHGGMGVHYELHEVRTGRLVAEFTPAVLPDNRSSAPTNVPKWVADLNAKR